ncbi:amino acid ABC transporter permease [Streptomyces aureus]
MGLGLNQGAYTSEVVRAGMLSIDEGQTEAAQALGMSRLRTLGQIVLPQAMRVILPPIGNETIGMLKTTSLASAIGVSEILSEAQHIYFVNNRIMELLIVVPCGIWPRSRSSRSSSTTWNGTSPRAAAVARCPRRLCSGCARP